MLGLNIKELFKKLALELPGISAQAEAKAREEESKNGVLLSSIALQILTQSFSSFFIQLIELAVKL